MVPHTKFLHLSSDAEWQDAERITNSRLITTMPDDAHGVVVLYRPHTTSVDQWALLRCPVDPPYSITLECCGPHCAQRRSDLMNIVQQVASSVIGS
jgi:hypothetical protein